MKRWIRHLGWAVAVPALLAGCLEPPNRSAKAGPGGSTPAAAKQPPRSELPVTLTIKSSSWTVTPGRTFITCEFVFENASAEPIELAAPVLWELELTTPAGEVFDAVPAELAGEAKPIVIPASRPATVKIFNLRDYFAIIDPGTYTLRAVVRDHDGREVVSEPSAIEVSEAAAQGR